MNVPNVLVNIQILILKSAAKKKTKNLIYAVKIILFLLQF